MCGLAGFFDPSLSSGSDRLRNLARIMADTIFHRGPDDSGEWVDERAGIALSHRRLSIIDLSPEGHQPMISPSGRYVIVYNGEVFNFPTLRRELEGRGCSFRGHSDTEVMLTAIETWGLEAAVQRFVGMFAFALWDSRECQLHLVRDRLGIKPLYYGWVNKCFVFGSELKAIKAFPRFDNGIDRDSLALFMRHCYVPAPYSIYHNISKLLPGKILTLGSNDCEREPKISTYWSAKDIVNAGLAEPFTGSTSDAVEQLHTLLREAVAMRMISDVSLGAFLSGGYDSSLVVALMQAQSERPVKTFSIGFYEHEYNEANYAKTIADHLGTDHTELYVTSEEAMAVIPRLPTLYDEPFSDSSQIPTFLVSQMARQHVSVSLSGDGGDELFSGYNRYMWGDRMWNNVRLLPRGLRSPVAKFMTFASSQTINELFTLIAPMLPNRARVRLPGDKIHKLAEILTVDSPDELYHRLVSHWKNPTKVVLGSEEPLTALTDPSRKSGLKNFTQQMMFTDLISYLPDDILTKLDRANGSEPGGARSTTGPPSSGICLAFAAKLEGT